MGEMGEIFKAMREESRDRRERNRSSSSDILKRKGVQFEFKNGGVHLIVQGKGEVIDFWPSTGKWIVRAAKTGKERKPSEEGRGVFSLLKRLGVEK